MPGRHQHQPVRMRRRRGLSWLAAAAAGVASLGAAVLAFSATDSAVAAAPTPSYHAGSDNATFTVLGVLDSNCLISTGGTEVWIKPGDAIKFDSSLVGVNVAGLPLHIGAIAGLNINAVIDAGTTHKQSFSVAGGKTTLFPGTKWNALAAGDHTLTWTATGVSLLTGINLPLSVGALKSGASLSWSGVIHVTNNAPQCKLSVSTPKTEISVGPIKVTVPPINVTVPGITVPTSLPSVPNLNPSQPGKTSQAPKPGKSTSAGQPLLPVPARVVPQGSGDGVFGNIGTGNYAAGSLPDVSTQLGNLAPLLPVTKTSATPSDGPAQQNSTGKNKTIDLAAGRAASSQIPVILAVLAMIALVLVAGTYARLFLLRKTP
ncbi:MAG: hypothetical protein QOG01_3757 [Pseudonocardiales bacterium]|nr:hypothetical protein [Pseudonocardiales bacterium]